MKINFKEDLSDIKDLSPNFLVNKLLKSRGIAQTKEFLSPPHPESCSIADFGTKKQIQITLSLLKKIQKKKGTIVVYSDYDADGITGAAILWETLHLLGFHAMPYVPHRMHEGYGFSIKGIDAVKKQFNPDLIISVDHGITAEEKIKYARSIGIPIIVTDHHLKPENPPISAEAVFHIPALSGSGVSYFFSKMLFDEFGEKNNPNYQLLKTNFSVDYPALATIGTVADLVPLIGLSRNLVYHGLQAFQKTQRIGIKEILRDAGIEHRSISTYEIGFMIAPRINAAGRLTHALDALRLLCTHDEKKASELAHHIGLTNQQRQNMVEQAVDEALKSVSSDDAEQKILILVSKTWHEGIIGLIASKLVEKYFRPAIVITQADGFLKASARSIPGFDITVFLRSHKEFLIDIGGHTQAAGFTIQQKNLLSFIKTIKTRAKKEISEKLLTPIFHADFNIQSSQLNLTLGKAVKKLAPFGVGNPQPTFVSKAILTDMRRMGKKGEHLKLWIKNIDSPHPPLELIKFNGTEKLSHLIRGNTYEFAYSIDINTWNNKETVQGRLITVNETK